MQTYAGIDLHSSNCYLAVIDEQQRRLYSKRLPNSLDHILSALQPFKDFRDDLAYRRECSEQGPIIGVDIPEVYRIRHSKTTYQ